MRFLAWILVAIGLAGFLGAANCKRVAPDEIGIRTISGSKGLVRQDYDAGFYRAIWLVDLWETLPRSVQKVSFTDRSDLRGPNDAAMVEAKTIDGDSVSIEASVLFRIQEGQGHVVYEQARTTEGFLRLARSLASQDFPVAFATLRTEQIYDAEARREAYGKLEENLRRKFAQNHIDLVDIAITGVTFDPKYEEQLEKKKVATQKTELEKSQLRREEETGIKNGIIQKTDNLVKEIDNDLRNQKVEIEANTKKETETIDAEARRIAATKRAQALEHRALAEAAGSQAVKEAEAYSVERKKAAIAGDAANWIAYLAAQNFPVRSVQMPSVGIDWFNPYALSRQVGALLDTARAGAQPVDPSEN